MIDQLIKAAVTALAVTHAHYPLVFNLWLPLMFGAYITGGITMRVGAMSWDEYFEELKKRGRVPSVDLQGGHSPTYQEWAQRIENEDRRLKKQHGYPDRSKGPKVPDVFYE